MVSLPHIFQRNDSKIHGHYNNNDYGDEKLSNFFCNNCTTALALPVRNINPSILQEYEYNHAQIRNMERVIRQEDTITDENYEIQRLTCDDRKKNQISDVSKGNIQIYAFGFPLIQQSQLNTSKSDQFNWEKLKEKMLKRQSRCKILHKPQQLKNDKQMQSTNVQNKRGLPRLTTKKWKGWMNNNFFGTETYPQRDLRADPTEVTFENFEVGEYYEKKCKITNISCRKSCFQIIPFSKDSQFRFSTERPINSLAPGLSVVVTIEFYCQSLADVEDWLVVKSKNGEDLVVTVIAASPPPHLIEVNDTTCNTDEVVDSLVNCGSHFVGEKGETILTLKNVGSGARFCFITESNWVNLEFNIDSSNTLRAEAFSVQPMMFSLKKDQEITIVVTAAPSSEGLHTASLLLLCDNGSLNNVDLLCDGLLYERHLIGHLNLMKTFDIDIQDVTFSDCFIDFGQMLSCDSKYHCFYMFSTASLNISYHWELRQMSLPGVEPLPNVALRISPNCGRLASQLVEMFYVHLDTSLLQPGVYKTLLVLVADDLPKKCIPLKYCDRILPCEENDDRELRSIESKYIEVRVECVSPAILLFPYIIDFSDYPLTIGEKEQREVLVKNESPGEVVLTWILYKECSSVRLCMEPTRIKCEKYSTYNCSLSIEVIEEGTFSLSLWCISEKFNAQVELFVKGYCTKPNLSTLRDSVDFGLVKIGSHQTTGLLAKNESCSHSFQWNLDELYFRSPDEGLVKINSAPTSLSTNSGEFCHKNSEVLVNYRLKSEEDAIWCSVLDWNGTFIPLTADIQEPDVSLSNYTLSADPFYLGVQSKMQLTITNHSLIGAAVFWGCPMDLTNYKLMTIDVLPVNCILAPGESKVIDITLTPHKTGQLDNIFIPCFVEGNHQPLLLKIEGNVEGLRIRVEWDSKSRHCCIIWPPIEQERANKSAKDSQDENLCICPPNSPEPSENSICNSNCEILPVDSNFSITLDTNNRTPTSSVLGEFIVETNNKEIPFWEDDKISLASSIPYLNWPLVGGRYTRDKMNEEWENKFNNLFILDELATHVKISECSNSYPNEYDLCFHDIPTRKSITQNIYIRNDTAISSTFEASVAYNFERCGDSKKNPNDEDILRKIRADDYDNEYVERASRHHGLTVFVTPETGHLPSQDYVTLSVTVVAFSWGHYSDVIVLQVGDLHHLCVRLSVSVTQTPIVAPQLIRFGTLHPESVPVSRTFKVENVSTVPVYICWQIFTSSPANFPFSAVLFDGDPFDIQLTDYYGSQSTQIFEVNKRYTVLEPGSSTNIDVNFYPHLGDCDSNRKCFVGKISAILIGHIYLTDKGALKTKDENCHRDDGSKLTPLRVEMEVVLEVPFLSLLNVFKHQITFKCTAYNVISSKDKTWKSERVIRVLNKSNTHLKAKVYTVGYFYVSKIEYTCSERKQVSSRKIISLLPGETCEVTVVCKVTESNFLDCFEPDTELLEDDTVEPVSVEHGLLCFEEKCVRQDVKLELWLSPPLLQFSEPSLMFGSVYLEDTKTLIINISSPLNEDSFEAFIKSGPNGPFSINVTTGMLKPKIGYLLQVFFTPQDTIVYQDVLVVISSLRTMFREIPLSGIGTFDYKVHNY